MKFLEAIIIVKERTCLAVSLNHEKKEVFIIEYNTGPEKDLYITIYCSRETGPYEGEEGSFSPEEFVEEFPEYEQLDFSKMKKNGEYALDETWEYAVETVKRNLIK